MVALLLEKVQRVVDSKDHRSRTCLHFAAQRGHVAIARLLLDHGAGVNATCELGETPLHEAACNSDTNMIDLLITFGADVSAASLCGTTPILNAAEEGQVEAYKALLHYGADERLTDNLKIPALHRAVCFGHFGLVQYLLDRGWDANEGTCQDQTAFHIAAECGHKDILALLFDHGDYTASFDEVGNTPPHQAIICGHVDCLHLFLERGRTEISEVRNIHGMTLLHTAAGFGRLDAPKLLVSRFPGSIENYTKYGTTALHLAIINRHVSAIECLIEHGAATDTLAQGNRTSMQLALRSGHIAAVTVLLKELHRAMDGLRPHPSAPTAHRLRGSRSLPLIKAHESTSEGEKLDQEDCSTGEPRLLTCMVSVWEESDDEGTVASVR